MSKMVLFYNGKRIDELCSAEAKEALAEIAIDASRGVNHPHDTVKRLYSIGYGVNYKDKPDSIFEGLDDKQALRVMADECAKRGLSIMVNMEMLSCDDMIALKPRSIMHRYVIERNSFLGFEADFMNQQVMAFKPKKETITSKCVMGESIKESDRAFAKIMKTIKDYQDRLK